MDILAQSSGCNKERKVVVFFFFFFPYRRWLAAAETGRGRVLYPGVQFPCYLSHCFFPHCSGVQLGQSEHKKGPGAQSTLKNLASSLDSETVAQHVSYLTPRRYKYRHVLLVFHVCQQEESHCTQV
ncbi:hypothetical protein AMECASPLE_000919 [Ameca splendens]|uniref:Uncharacterized protein n=1 Tax=Ameca splendens TaxID=208324 RepID=A0ABV0ZUZ2_9TELE